MALRARAQTVLRAPVDGAGLPRARFFVKVLIVFKFHAKVVHASGVGSERKDSAPPFAFEPRLLFSGIPWYLFRLQLRACYNNFYSCISRVYSCMHRLQL